MKKVLVTGCSGLVGTHLIKKCIDLESLNESMQININQNDDFEKIAISLSFKN